MQSVSGQSVLAGRSSGRAFSANSRSLRPVIKAAIALPADFTTVKPIGDRILVKVQAEEVRSAGGIYLPASAQKKPTAGDVVSLASDVKDVKLGDNVIYSKYAGTEIAVGETDHVLLKEDDVIGTMTASKKIKDLRPLQDRVLIKNVDAKTTTSGGVLLTTEAADKPTVGEIVAVGPGKRCEDTDEITPPNVQLGNSVLYSKYSGTEFEEDDMQYIVIRETDILAVLS